VTPNAGRSLATRTAGGRTECVTPLSLDPNGSLEPNGQAGRDNPRARPAWPSVISVKVAGRHLTVVDTAEPVADHVRWLGYVSEQMSVNLDLIALSTSVGRCSQLRS
jgi:hypothetical protein